ncbi:hypothetical protein [Tibeticola sp.]|uniref:hypothetical protein n=1 Tax=Tibeticola sp. TaxID=2005368 RepID=UPI0025DCEBD7|nr:hypothetical protein [Tibeticola sp.]
MNTENKAIAALAAATTAANKETVALNSGVPSCIFKLISYIFMLVRLPLTRHQQTAIDDDPIYLKSKISANTLIHEKSVAIENLLNQRLDTLCTH